MNMTKKAYLALKRYMNVNGDFVKNSEGNKENRKASVILKHELSGTECWWKYEIKVNNKKELCVLLLETVGKVTLVPKWQKSQLDCVVCKVEVASNELGHLAEEISGSVETAA